MADSFLVYQRENKQQKPYVFLCGRITGFSSEFNGLIGAEVKTAKTVSVQDSDLMDVEEKIREEGFVGELIRHDYRGEAEYPLELKAFPNFDDMANKMRRIGIVKIGG